MRILINIDVPDLTAAIHFYCTALGLTLNRIMDNDVAELSGGSSTLYLLLNPAGSKIDSQASEVRHYARHWTPVHMDFVVDNIVAAAQQAINAGAIQESECITWNGSTCITFSDPFGHGFCLIEFAGTTYGDENNSASGIASV